MSYESVVLGDIIRSKQKLRDELNGDVERFKANGGKVQYLRPGESAAGYHERISIAKIKPEEPR